jgi:hypothetical protein
MSSLHALHQKGLDLRYTSEEELQHNLTRTSTLADKGSHPTLALIAASDSIAAKC